LKSELLLGEGNESDLKEAEAGVDRLIRRKINNYKEIQALRLAKIKAEKETSKAEEEARAKAMQMVFPLYQTEVAKTWEILQAGEAQNQRVEDFETLASKRGLPLNRGSFGSPTSLRIWLSRLAFKISRKAWWGS
jgi:hypothetical protein